MCILLKLLIFIPLFVNFSVTAQVNFKKDWTDADPIKSTDTFSTIEKINRHNTYLKTAVAQKNLTQQFYGHLYLYKDYLDELDYAAAANYLMQAEDIADKSGNTDWMGNIKSKTGWLAFTVNKDSKKAIAEYRLELQYCTAAKDSVCMGHALEQMSMVYGNDKIFDSAHYYFNLAIPLIKKFTNSNLSAAYNNFTNLLAYQGHSAEGLIYIDSAIAIARQKKDIRSETIFLTNRGLLLGELKQFDASLKLLKDCAAVNIKNKWLDNLVFDYSGMVIVYEQQGDFKNAYHYTEKYHALNDSLTGVAINLKIADLAAKNKTQQKQLELNASTEALERRSWVIGLSLLTIVFGAGAWYANNKSNKKKSIESKVNLDILTRLLADKNSMLSNNEEKIAALQSQLQTKSQESAITPPENNQPIVNENLLTAKDVAEFEDIIYNQRILTNEDWSAFKNYFTKAYPGYLSRLRIAFPALTEAEERLFLFIKLNLKNKESAAILGISTDSVKKARSRLRKRLGMQENVDLETYVSNF